MPNSLTNSERRPRRPPLRTTEREGRAGLLLPRESCRRESRVPDKFRNSEPHAKDLCETVLCGPLRFDPSFLPPGEIPSGGLVACGVGAEHERLGISRPRLEMTTRRGSRRRVTYPAEAAPRTIDSLGGAGIFSRARRNANAESRFIVPLLLREGVRGISRSDVAVTAHQPQPSAEAIVRMIFSVARQSPIALWSPAGRRWKR